jgi:hypothetical protein
MRTGLSLSIELAFRRIIGEGNLGFNGILTASIFENGKTSDIGRLILYLANTLKCVLEHMNFNPEEQGEHGPQALLILQIEKLEGIGNAMEQMPDRVLNDCDWDIISCLLFIIAGFIEHYDLRD